MVNQFLLALALENSFGINAVPYRFTVRAGASLRLRLSPRIITMFHCIGYLDAVASLQPSCTVFAENDAGSKSLFSDIFSSIRKMH